MDADDAPATGLECLDCDAASNLRPGSLGSGEKLAGEVDRLDGKSDSQWMVLARAEADLGKMATTPAHWERVPVTPGPIWRDDFANLLKVWKKRDEH